MKQLTSFTDWLAMDCASCRNPCSGHSAERRARLRLALWEV